MGRSEYDANIAKTEADFSFVDQIDQLFVESDESSLGQVRYQATKDGLVGETSIVLEEYNAIAGDTDETAIDVMFWTERGEPADSNYSIRVATLPQKNQLTEESGPLVTQYDVQRYGNQYIGYVYQSFIDEGREMTPYDYRELQRTLALARAVQLAERRERAMIRE